jgi:hypothetical protein
MKTYLILMAIIIACAGCDRDNNDKTHRVRINKAQRVQIENTHRAQIDKRFDDIIKKTVERSRGYAQTEPPREAETVKQEIIYPEATNVQPPVPQQPTPQPQPLAKQPVPQVETKEWLINILLFDKQGNMECYKRVLVANINQVGDCLKSFKANDKTIICNKVAVSYSYTDLDNPKMAIVWPSDKSKSIEVLSSNIYRSVGGGIWYGDNNHYLLAPKGAQLVILSEQTKQKEK